MSEVATPEFRAAFPLDRKYKYVFGFSKESSKPKMCVYDLITNNFIGAFIFDEVDQKNILEWVVECELRKRRKGRNHE